MNTPLVIAAALGLFATGPSRAADPGHPARAEVVFDHPEKFTDVKDSVFSTDKGPRNILDALRKYIISEADNYFVPQGYALKVTFSNIDLAGDYEPWLGPKYDDIRIVKPIYPPAFRFTYTVTNAAGAIVKQGEENIRDLGFDMRSAIDRSDPLRYEKDILNDWMRSTLRGIK